MKKVLTFLAIFSSLFLSAEISAEMKALAKKTFEYRSSKCKAPTSRIDLDINNVRTTILNGGDMWWDLDNEQYEIPKGSNKHSIYAGSIMIGGIDQTGNLKMAALTHRTKGSDFWPGPIDVNNVSTDAESCDQYDKHFKLYKKDIEDYVTAYRAGDNPSVPASMLTYPAHGSVASGHDYYLAPFYDADSNGTYNPLKGDYPAYDIGDADMDKWANGRLNGDQTIWWIFNDVGNIHTESGADAVGLEIHAQAFAFATNDEVNNMTFYNYKIINRSSFKIENCYMGVWVDTDLGNADDDFVGCDVERGLGYCYNGDANDEGIKGYGLDPPAVGIDFFEGPVADVNDGVDNDKDGTIDEVGELISMSKFVYYNIGAGDQGDPNTASDYYNYLRGRWKNGSQMEYGGNGYGPSGTTSGIPCDYMFPDDSDQSNYWGTGGAIVPVWNETTAGNSPDDRRFIQSAGPFTLEPGAVNNVTTGVVWAEANQGEGAWSAVENLKEADDKAQALFDNKFKILDGPDAPDLAIQEMNNSLILMLENGEGSNNYNEKYEELDPLIVSPPGNTYDDLYRFQGYQVFQLQNRTVSSSNLNDVSKARLVWQSDIKDGVAKLVNHNYDPSIGFNVPVVMVDGSDNGIEHSIQITRDLFATGDDKLVNHKEYYYMVVAYAYNNYKTYVSGGDGQKFPFKAGRRNLKVYTAIPHDPSIEGKGTGFKGKYGISPEVKQVAGIGNGGNFVNLSKETIVEILSSTSHKADEPLYAMYGSPVGIKVIDPLKVPDGDFRFEILDSVTSGDLSDAYWRLLFMPKGKASYTDTVYSTSLISTKNEQIIKEWGFSVAVNDVDNIKTLSADNYGYLTDSVIYKDPSKPWLKGVEDLDGKSYQNWIRAGKDIGADFKANDFEDYFYVDTDPLELAEKAETFEKVANGWVAPFKYASHDVYGIVGLENPQWANDIAYLNSVDLVITSDRSKWSICPVFEMSDNAVSQGGADQLGLRAATTKDWEGNTLPAGMGYFPGYAIDVTTGERLNIGFGESSFFAGDNGADMKWNPSSTKYSTGDVPVFGGVHSVFVFRKSNDIPIYDEGEAIRNWLSAPGLLGPIKVFSACTWVFGYPITDPSYDFLATDVTLKIRVNKSYESTNGDLPIYEFNTDKIRALANQEEIARENLDKANVVPNPYYGYNNYEENRLDSKIKITNLPQECTVKIFTLDGTLVKTLKKDDDSITSLTWDMKNEQSVTIASGLYIFHINAPGIGEKIIKWFGVQKELDLETY